MSGANFQRPSKPRLTLETLHHEVLELRWRLEDLEDLRELNQAIERNSSKPRIPWSKAKKDLGLA
jgi:hypothetical protein